MTDIFETYIGKISLLWLTLLSNCKWDSNVSHSIQSCTRNWYPLMISLPWNVIDITWNVLPFEFLRSFVSLVLNNTRGLLFRLLYHELSVNKHPLNLNLKILWWYDEGNIVKKAWWWSDGWTDRRNEPIHRASWPQLKNVVKSGPSCGHHTFVLLCSFMISRRSRVGLFDFRALYKILLMAFQMCSIRRLIQAMAVDLM